MPIRKELRHFYCGPAWEAARAETRERSGDRCEQCGATNGTWAEKRGRRILIQCGCAHLDNNPANNAPENRAWLCRACHLHHDVPFHRLTRATRKDKARPLITKATEPYQTTIDDAIAFGKNFEAMGKE